MDFTINCTRVLIPQGTTQYGIPVDIGPVPALPGPVSDHDTFTGVLNDGDPSNLIRQASPDGEESGPSQNTSNKYIVNCKKHTIISSFNARTLGPIGRLEELAESTKSQGIDIVAVQEHRFHHPDDILKYHQVGSYQLVTSSASKNSSSASV